MYKRQDEKAQRFSFDIRTISWLHADFVIALFGLTLALFLVTRGLDQTKRLVIKFSVVALLQGAIGYIQYFTGIPEILVAAHLLGATLVWIAAWRVRISIKEEEVR